MAGWTTPGLSFALRLGMAASLLGAGLQPTIAAAPNARVAAPLLPSVLRPGALASGSLHLVGLRLAAPQERIDAPSGAALLIPIPVLLGSRAATAAELAQLLPAGAQLEGTFTGPGISATTLKGTLGNGLPVPALGAAGEYKITGIRIAKDGTTLVDAPGQVVSIRCLGDVLISSVTSTPMTMDEIRASGIQLGQGDYVASRFTLALAIGSNTVNLRVPVAIPVYNGVASLGGEAELGRLELEPGGAGQVPDLQVALGDLTPMDTLTLARPEMAHLARHAFKSLVVIPGSIGYLHQFFRANLVVINALPKDNPEYAGYKVGKLTATLAIPAAESSSLLPRSELRQSLHGASGDSAGPGENATGTWIVEGVKEGGHLLEFQIQGEFTGGALTGPVPILGTARTKVLVRNPSFDLLLVHPDVVRRGETYVLEARLTNTSGALANGVSISLDQARMGNVRVVGSATQSVDTLRPGETASLKFTLRALRNGAVIASYLYSESGGIGFQIATGLGERNVRLNPDTLLLPQTLDPLPSGLRDAALRVLGQAWSVATCKGALPPGVLPVRASTVTGTLADALSEAGLVLRMGGGKERVWAMLWRAFTQNGDPGFDQLLRTTTAGAELRSELLQARTAWAGAGSLTNQLRTLAEWNLEGELPVLLAVDGAGAGLVAEFAGADGSLSRGSAAATALDGPWSAFAVEGASMFFQNRFPAGGGQLRLRNGGTTNQDLSVAVAAPLANAALPPTLNTYHLVLPPGSEARIDLGTLRGPPAVILLPAGGGSSALADSTRDLQPEPFRVLAVHRYDLEMDPKATPFGTHVMVLFNRPNQPLNLPSGEEGFRQGSALVQVEGNALWRKAMPVDSSTGQPIPSPAALVQASPRVVSVYLERPVGPNIPRRLTLSGSWRSAAGHSLSGGAFPILCGQIPGGAIVKGKVRRPTGQSLPATLSYWHLVGQDEGGVDLFSGQFFEEDYWALVSNNIEVGADGSFQFDYIPEPAKTARGMFTLTAQTAEGGASGSASVLGNGQQLDLDLVLEGRGDVLGRLVDGTGAPLASAAVQLTAEQASGGGTLNNTDQRGLVTGADGRFSFQGVRAGVFSLRFRKGNIGAARSGAVAPQGGPTDLGDIKLEAATGTLRVKVLNPDGSPCANQKVLLAIPAGLLRSGGPVEFVPVEAAGTDASGLAVFPWVPAGDVGARLPYTAGQGPSWYGFLKPGETLEATLQLRDPRQLARITVEVKDGRGQAVPSAGLALLYGQARVWRAVTDADGRAVLPALPDTPFGVVVHHPDWSPEGFSSATLTPRSGESLTLPVTMPARCRVTGKVTRPDGSPVVGAYVAIPPVSTVVVLNRLTRTDGQGNYRLTGLDPAKGERIACVGPELATAVNQAIQGVAETELSLDLRLPAEGRNSLAGHVYQPGEPKLAAVADVEVYGELPDITPHPPDVSAGNLHWGLPVQVFTGTTRSAADGSFRLENLPSGPFLLQARSTFFPDWAKVNGEFLGPAEALVRDLTLVAKFAGAMEGQITLPDGQTKASAGVRVTLYSSQIGELTVESSADGRYAFAKVLPAGTYLLRAEDPASGARLVERLTLPTETNLIHNLRLWGQGRLTVHVQDALGQPLAAGVVTLVHSRQHLLAANDLPPLSQNLQPSSAGVLVWEGLLEGLLKVELKNPNGLQGLAGAEIPVGGGDAEVTVQLQPVGHVRGLFKRPDGSAVPAGRVDAYQGGRWLGLSNTRQDGVDGRFSFTGLPVGAVTLEAWDPDTRQTGKATVQVVENQTLDLVLVSNDLGTVNFKVTKDGAGVDRASLQVRYLGGPALGFSAESTCDALGQASFQLAPGSYAVLATDPVTLATGSLDLQRASGQAAMNLEIPLRPTRDLQVTVLAPTGYSGSLAGWQVRVSRGPIAGRLATLDAGGRATLAAMMAGGYTLAISDRSGKYRGSRDLTLVDAAGPQAATLQALARGSFEVTLLDAHGVLVTAGRIQIKGPPDPTATFASQVGTDLDGKARAASILEGRLEAEGWTLDTRFLAQGSSSLRSEGEVATLILTLEPSARFRGTLTTPAGQPLPWTRVNYRRTSRWVEGQLATDGAGQFASPPLPLGGYLLSADDGHGRAGSRSVALETADQLVTADFALGGAATLQGSVSDPLRNPVPQVSVEVWPRLQGGMLARTTVDAAGGYRLANLPTGQLLDLRVRMDDGVTLGHQESLTLQIDGATVQRDLLLDPLPRLKGRTFAADGATHRSMVVKLCDAQGNPLTVTGPDGVRPLQAATSADHPTFQLDYLAPGSYQLRGYDEVRLLAYRALSVTAAPEAQTADLTALPLRDLKLQLRYPDGSALAASGHVRLTPLLNPADVQQGDLDASGALVLRSVVPGAVRLDVTGVANQPALTTTVTVVAGTDLQAVDLPAVGEGSLRVRIRTDAGRILAGAALSVRIGSAPVWNGVAQADGSYLVSKVWVGSNLILEASGFGVLRPAPAAKLLNHGDSLELTWTAPNQGSLLGLLRGADGLPAAGAAVALDGGAAQLTDATGTFRFDAVTAGEDHSLRAEAAGTSPEWVAATTRLAADAEQKSVELKLPGIGAVVVSSRDRRGDPLPAASVVVTTQNRSNRIKTVVTDASGQARIDGVMAAEVLAQATLEGRPVSARGNLTAGGTLALELRAPDATLVSGAIKRAGATATWPAGSVALLNGVSVALKPDGGLANPVDLPYYADPMSISVRLPAVAGGRSFSFAGVPMVKNGDTLLALTAPPFGGVELSVLRKDGSPAAAAKLQGEGGLLASADATGKYSFLALDPGPRAFHAVSGDEAGRVDSNLAEDGQVVAVTLQLGDRLDVSGRYTDFLGVDFVLFQEGARVFGSWNPGSGPYTLDGTLVELAWKGSAKDAVGTVKGTLDTLFSPDGRTVAGAITGLRSSWNATRKPGAAVLVEPATAIQRISSLKSYRAHVAGIADKAVEWTASAGTIAANGAFTAPAVAGPVTLTATSHGDPTQKAEATVQVRLPLTLSPASLVLQPGQSATVTAIPTGVDPADLVWTVDVGSLVPAADHLSAVYTAPTAAGSATLSVASSREPEVKATVAITIVAGSITLSPASGQVYAEERFPVRATVSGLADTTLTWTASAGTVTGSGLSVDFRPPATAGPVTLSAASTSNPLVQATATFQVVRRGTLELRVRSADGGILVNRNVTLSWAGGGQTQPVNVTNSFTNLPVGTEITLKDASADGSDPWKPPIPGRTFTLASGELKSLDLTVPLGKLTLQLSRAGAPLAEVAVGLAAGGRARPGSAPRSDATGRVGFVDVPLDVPITATLYGQGRNLIQTFTLTQGETTLPVAWPANKLTLRLLRGGQPIAGATAQLSGAMTAWNLGPSDAAGLLVIDELPLNAPFTVQLRRHPVEVVRDLTLTQAETSLDVEWPPLAKVTVTLQRKNGQPLPATGWQWSASPGGEGTAPEGEGPEQTWMDLPQGCEQQVVATLSLFLDGNQVFNPGWTGQTTFTPAAAAETRVLALPALASLRFAFKDKAGQPLSGSLQGDSLTLSYPAENGGFTFVMDAFERAVLPEIVPEGTYTFELSSSRWGPLDPITVTVGPADDGKEIVVPVTLPWVKTTCALKVLAGDHETPVPLARIVATRGDGSEIELGRTGREASDAGFTGSFLGPEENLQVVARFTPRRGEAEVASPAAALHGGGTMTATLEIPLTVVRSKLLESDGSTLDGQGLLAKGRTELGAADDCPTAVVAGTRYGVLLGEPAAAELDLGLYDPDSGLGQCAIVTVPALGGNRTVEQRLAAHAWLGAATFTPAGAPPPASRLLLAVAAAELVHPAAASWVLDGGRLAPFRVPAALTRDGLRPGYSQELAPATVPDLAHPPQPFTRTLARVRLPLAGEVWAGEWKLAATENRDDLNNLVSVTVAAQPGRWGRLAFTALADEAKVLALVETTPTWKATPVQVQDQAGQPPQGAALQNLGLAAWPDHAPDGWRVTLPFTWDAPADGGPDALGMWHPTLPIGTPIHLENQPTSCGPGSWWYGALDFNPADPPPATAPLLKLSEEKPLPPCIPVPPRAAKRKRDVGPQTVPGRSIRRGGVR